MFLKKEGIKKERGADIPFCTMPVVHCTNKFRGIKLGFNSFSVGVDHTTHLKPVEDTQAQLKHYIPM